MALLIAGLLACGLRSERSVGRYLGKWVPQGRFYNGLDAPVTDIQIRSNLRFVMTKLQPPTATNARFRLASFVVPDDADLGKSGEVNLDLSIEPNDWDGWDSLEQTRDLWVFGYGSLVTAGEIEHTIGRSIDTAFEYRTATLVGYRRKWNAGMRNRHNDPTDKHYELPDGTRPDRTISALGIEPDQDFNVNGVVFRVSRVELRALDRRERRYRRIECSRQIVAEPPIAGQVFTYTPLESAMSLTAASRADGSDTVSEKYKLLVERGFQSLGPDAYAEYLASTEVPTSPVMPLRIKRPDQAARSGDDVT